MSKTTEYIRQHKSVLIIALLLAALIAAAIFLYGGNLSSSSSQTDLTSNRSEKEIKLMRILSEMEGVGDSEVMIYEDDGEIQGVVVVCEGADSIMTRNDILNAVSCALKIEKSYIAIYAMNK